MEDLFEDPWNTQTNSQGPFGFDDTNNHNPQENHTTIDPLSGLFSGSSDNDNILDDIFGTTNASQQNVNINSNLGFVAETVQTVKTAKNNKANDMIWDLIENPNPNNDVTKLFNNVTVTNDSKSKTKKNKRSTTSNLRNEGMLTKKIKQISRISPAAKWFIAAYFKHECECSDDIIIPECVEILGLMYLGHPAFIHCYIADNKYAQPLQITHKLFIVFGYHTLNDIVDEYFNCSRVVRAIESHESQKQKAAKKKNVQSDFALNDLFTEKIDEKEHRVWRREIKMPIPPYNGCYKETFNHIDELFFAEDDGFGLSQNTDMMQTTGYNDWDEFLGIEESKKEKKVIIDDWKCVDEAMESLFDNNGLCEIEILIEQKDILGDWIRDYEEAEDPVVEFSYLKGLGISQMAFCKKEDIAREKILNLKHWK